MKILWFCTDPGVYRKDSGSYSIGGGWVTTLLENLKKQHPEWQIGICCAGVGVWGEKNVLYTRFPYSKQMPCRLRLKKFFDLETESQYFLPFALKAVNDFQPDIIQVFGTESVWGIIAQYVDIPVIIHFQGALTPYCNAYFPPAVSRNMYLFSSWNFKQIVQKFHIDRVFRARAKREIAIIQACLHLLGRTDWDLAVIRQYNPNAAYYKCWELLRPAFSANKTSWTPPVDKSAQIVSVISTPVYKGQDLILKTASLLAGQGVDFVWEVWGIYDLSFFEKITGINHKDVHVKICGVQRDPEKLKETLLSANCYVHPSYIENSPNSLCEAQILGVPVIAADVGGVGSIVEHKKTGVLVPANDPWILAYRIKQIVQNVDFAQQLSIAGRQCALERHDPETITRGVVEAYEKIVREGKG